MDYSEIDQDQRKNVLSGFFLDLHSGFGPPHVSQSCVDVD